MSYLIRLAGKNDIPAMLDIYDYYVRETTVSFEYETPSLSEFTRRYESFTSQFPWFALEEDGRIIGYAYAHHYAERAAYGWTVESTIYLDKDCHGKGLGRALYSCLLETLKMQGYKTVVGIISYPNDKSEKFHKALGFELHGLIPNAGYKLGSWCGTTRYSIKLGDYDIPPVPPLTIDTVKETPEFKALLAESVKAIRE